MNKIGIYFAFWERNWNADYCKYIKKVQKLGFDTLELGAGALSDMSYDQLKVIADTAKEEGIDLTYCIGLPAEYNVSSLDPAVKKNAVEYMTDLLKRINFMGGDMLGGIIYAFWPGVTDSYEGKIKARQSSLDSIKTLSHIAGDLGITLCLEIVNRFEQYIINTVDEGIDYLQELKALGGREENVKLLLDSFHMNIEETSIYESVLKAGSKNMIGHFHIGECNRMPPGMGKRMPWGEIQKALTECDYTGRIVMEPFIKIGGEVGRDIKVYHDLSNNCDENAMDDMARNACIFTRRNIAHE